MIAIARTLSRSTPPADLFERSASPRDRSVRFWYRCGRNRFQATLRQIEDWLSQSGAALASEAGFFDQAHLTLDLARLAGATPRHLASNSVADFSKTRCDDPL
jgi:hypothetical protein